MIKLLKTFLKGLLYVIGLPFFLIILVIFAAFGMLFFLFQIIKSVFYFFTGQTFFPELPEDRELRLLNQKANNETENKKIVEEDNEFASPIYTTPFSNNEYVTNAFEPASVEEACFKEENDENDIVEEEQNIEQVTNEEDNIEPSFQEIEQNNLEEIKETNETVLETSQQEEIQEPEEELDTYVPRSSSFENLVDDDDDENATNSGVNIDFDL